MAPSTTCSHGGIVEGLLCQCPAPGEHSGPYRWDGRGLVPGWDRTGTPAVPCDGHRLGTVSPACAGLPRSAVSVAPRLPSPPSVPLPVPRTRCLVPPCPCLAPLAVAYQVIIRHSGGRPLPRAPGRCSSARLLLGRATCRPGCLPARCATAARCSPLPAAASCHPAAASCCPAVLSRPSRLCRHSAYLLLRVLRVFTCSASALPPPTPPRPVSLVALSSSSCRGCLRTVNVRAPRAVPGSRHFIRESARGRVSRGRSGGAGRVRWVPVGAGRGPGGSGVRENGGESTLAIVLIFCMSEGARTTSEGPEGDTHARVAE